jgi:hypothetical protein
MSFSSFTSIYRVVFHPILCSLFCPSLANKMSNGSHSFSAMIVSLWESCLRYWLVCPLLYYRVLALGLELGTLADLES